MPKFWGENDKLTWISRRYFMRYGVHTALVDQFVGKQVLIRTNGGLWAPDGHGYVIDPADAGRYDFLEALATIKNLGPEKHASIILLKTA